MTLYGYEFREQPAPVDVEEIVNPNIRLVPFSPTVFFFVSMALTQPLSEQQIDASPDLFGLQERELEGPRCRLGFVRRSLDGFRMRNCAL
jgi:hypothetical protein